MCPATQVALTVMLPGMPYIFKTKDYVVYNGVWRTQRGEAVFLDTRQTGRVITTTVSVQDEGGRKEMKKERESRNEKVFTLIITVKAGHTTRN